MLVIESLRLGLDEGREELRRKAAARLGTDDIKEMILLRESLDARKKDDIHFICKVGVRLGGDERGIAETRQGVALMREADSVPLVPGDTPLDSPPVVIGAGPAGLLAAFTLAKAGYRPIVFERGASVDEREKQVSALLKRGEFNPESNIAFGEGGAGTFSDGKLTFRARDAEGLLALQTLHECGAPEDVRYSARAHIGTDVLRGVIKNLRERIISMRGEFCFNRRIDGFELDSEGIRALVSAGQRIPARAVILATGHSARDVWDMLLKSGVVLSRKPMSVGLRAEHPQRFIDEAQFGRMAGHKRLGAASYALKAYSSAAGRDVYTFCMCPGGQVVNASTEEGALCVNGMSRHARDLPNANSAIVTSIRPEEYSSFGDGPLAGVEFQRHYELLAYALGGGGFKAPVERMQDFLGGSRQPGEPREVMSSYAGGVTPADLSKCLPEVAYTAICEAIRRFDGQLRGYNMPGALLTGVEMRTSSPVRIDRGANGCALNTAGLYPAGEGAGYAGGIVSSAADGIRAARMLISQYHV